MECGEALNLISGHIDRQNTVQEEAALQEHLSVCPDCRALLQAYEQIDRNVSELEVPAPDSLAPAVMSQIFKQEKKKKIAPWLGAGTAAGIVAAVLFLLVGTKALSLPKLSDVKINEDALMMTKATSATIKRAEPFPLAEASPVPTADEAETALQAPMETAVTDTQNSPIDDEDLYQDLPLINVNKADPVKVEEHCKSLSSENMAPVLLYSGVDDYLFALLEQSAPALFERLYHSGEITLEEKTGVITIASDFATVAALQELFRQSLMTEEAERTVPEDELDELRGKCKKFGFDGTHLKKLVPYASRLESALVKKYLSEDFSEQWLTGENWLMFLPQEDYTPAEDDLAFLVLQPPEEAE